MELKTTAQSSVVRRVLATVLCVMAFAVMASIFSPDRTRAGGLSDQPWAGIPPKSVEYPESLINLGSMHLIAPHTEFELPSSDPHEGLQSLGIIEDCAYTIHIFATEGGPRFTVYERATGKECGALLSSSQVHQAFPDLQIPTMEFDADSPLMLADPVQEFWW